MIKASTPGDVSAETRIERLQHWIAVLVCALLHLLLLLLVMLSSRVTVTTSQGADAGSRVAVSFIGRTPPPVKATPASKPKAKPKSSRVQATRVTRADDPVPPVVIDAATQDHAEARAETPPAAPTPPAPQQPRAHIWGQPPGLMQEDVAPENAGLARSPAISRGRGHAFGAGEPSLEVNGYQVSYDLRSEIRLRAWRDQGMTELFLPLPGIRQYMVCPLETALKRESGPCRLLEADDPALEAIGDARQVINMQRVYRMGKLVWRGPGPYR
jgi:hypothetical protein